MTFKQCWFVKTTYATDPMWLQSIYSALEKLCWLLYPSWFLPDSSYKEAYSALINNLSSPGYIALNLQWIQFLKYLCEHACLCGMSWCVCVWRSKDNYGSLSSWFACSPLWRPSYLAHGFLGIVSILHLALATESRGVLPSPTFYMSSEDLNLGPHTCIKPSSQPNHLSVCNRLLTMVVSIQL